MADGRRLGGSLTIALGCAPRRALWGALGATLAAVGAASAQMMNSPIEISTCLCLERDLGTRQAETPQPASDAITFVVTPSALVTLRYSQPLAFTNFAHWVQRTPSACAGSDIAFMGLLEAIVDRAADVLERTSIEIDAIARGVFETRARAGVNSGTLQDALKGIGRHGTLISGISESLLSLNRANAFFSTSASTWLQKESKARVKTLDRDIRSLHDHATFLGQKVNFLLDATLGLINIEQNNIIKIFSVAAVAFLPPTLIASIYGMNFKEFPELNWSYGYPFALALMVLSAALPFYYFRRRGWL